MVLSVLAVVTLLVAACGNSDAGEGGGQKALAKFPIATFGGETYALDAIAKAQGFFAKHGLDVTFVSPSAGGGAANTLFLAGSVKGWAGNPQVILGDVAKGEKVTFTGSLDNWIPFAIQARSSSPLAKSANASFADKMKALQGKKVGLTGVGALVYYDLLAALKDSGVNPKSVTILGVGPATNGIGQLNAGKLDAYITYSRADALILQEQAKTVTYADLSGATAPPELQAFSSFAFPVLSSYAKSNPSQTAGYIAAMQDAYNWGKANIPAAAKIVSRATYQGKYEAEVTKGLQGAFAVPQPNGMKYNPKTLTDEIALLAKLGQLPAGAPTDPAFAYKNLVLSSAQM